MIDDSGVGGGVTDQLKAEGFEVFGFNAAAAANRKDDFPNRRSEIWFEAAAQMDQLDLDPDEQLAADLTGPRYSYDLKMRPRRREEGRDEEAPRPFTGSR